MNVYETTLTAPGDLSLDSYDRLLDTLREYGTAEPHKGNPREIDCRWEAVDGWDICDMMHTVLCEVTATYGIDWDLDKKFLKVNDPSADPVVLPVKLAEVLHDLAMRGLSVYRAECSDHDKRPKTCPECQSRLEATRILKQALGR